MGLFDALQNGDPVANRGLLDFGLALLSSRGNFGRALGESGLIGVQGADRYKAQLAAFERARLNDELLKAQLSQEQQKAKDREAMALRQQQVDAYLQSLQPITGVQANAATGIAGPRPEAAAAIGQRPTIDPIQAIRLLGPEGAKQLMESPNWGVPKVARTVETTDAKGMPQTQMFDDFGRPIGQALPQPVKMAMQDVGGQIVPINPYAPGGPLSKTMSPIEKDESLRGWRGLQLQNERLNLDRGASVADAGGPAQAALVKAFGKPPKDYRWKADGTAEPIPGGPADIKAGELGAKAEARKSAADAQAESVLSAVSRAKELVGYSTAGWGGLLANIPATDARNLQAQIQTIKANLGFDRLQQMREMSPTGGALGQVAVQELQALQSTVASLDQLQSVEQLKAALDKIEKHYRRWQETMGSRTGGSSGSFDAPEVGDVQDGYRFKGGNPADQKNWEKQ